MYFEVLRYNTQMDFFYTRLDHWHTLSQQDALSQLRVDPKKGLTDEEAGNRKLQLGANTLPQEQPPHAWVIFLSQFRSPLIFILVLAGVITFLFREYTDSAVIFGTVLLNTFIGYMQESKATSALSKLKQYLKHKTIVVRNGLEKEIPQENLVPGDIVILNAGSRVPADGRIIEAWNLRVNEAVLTGEWVGSWKKDIVLKEDVALADRDNMIYMGSVVEDGSGKAVITAIGVDTELGKISGLLKKVEETKTPYQKKLSQFSWVIGFVIVGISSVIFLEGIFTGKNVLEMFKIAVALSVAGIPEGLPIAMTIVLAIGMQRILRQRGLVRYLTSAETLGSTTVIATDKTLTLTEGKMRVEEVCPLRLADREETLVGAALANEAFIENPQDMLQDWIVRGRPTDRALLEAATEAGISKIELENRMPLLFRLPFASETKYVASVHAISEGTKAFVSGAPERILQLSALSEDERIQAEKKLQELTQRGLRVVGVAHKFFPEGEQQNVISRKDGFETALTQLNFLGFIALKDPLRKGVKEAIQMARQAGIETIIVTGDHALTARAIAKELGLPSEQSNTLEGNQLERIHDKELADHLEDITIFARVEPAHKLRIIEAWQQKHAIIAMTGDGVNDAPALKKADIGIALGSGTDVAKESADLVLLDDRFSIIPAAIREGRVILDNIRKIVTFMLSSAFTETVLIGASILLGAPFLPITALQILWINLVVDSLPGISLTMEKAERDVMKRKPSKTNAPLLNGEMKTIIFVIGALTDIILLGIFFWLMRVTDYSPAHIQTILFVGLGIDSLLYVFSCKSLRRNIWEYNPFSNSYLVWSVLFGFAALFSVIYLPILLEDIVPFSLNILHTEPLNGSDWALLFGFGLLNVWLIEFAKWIYKKRDKNYV